MTDDSMKVNKKPDKNYGISSVYIENDQLVSSSCEEGKKMPRQVTLGMLRYLLQLAREGNLAEVTRMLEYLVGEEKQSVTENN